MRSPTLDLLWVLRSELRYLEAGGYAKAAACAGRPPRIFEDSPTCPNYNNPFEETPCSECALLTLVPLHQRAGMAPCRNIVLNSAGETVEQISHGHGHIAAAKELKGWLSATIQAIEHARIQSMPWFPKDRLGPTAKHT